MRYQNPQLLYFLFAIAIPILIHLFNFRKHKTIYFSSIRFLKEIKEDKRKRSNLKNLLILLSRILAIFFLVMVFAKPFIPLNKEHKPTKNIFIYVDNSFSMDAENENGNLLAQAKEKARSICKSYPTESNFWLITNDFLAKYNKSVNANAIENYIDEISATVYSKNLTQIVNRQTSANTKNSHLYIISDMQNSSLQVESLNIIDSTTTLFLVPLTANKNKNLSIDSCWVNSPVFSTEKEVTLFASINNHSDKNINDQAVFLELNGKQKSQQYISLKAKEHKTFSFTFLTDNSTMQVGVIKINDHPITFDNNCYFTLKNTKKVNILCVNKIDHNTAITALFAEDTLLFNFKNTSNNINFNAIKQQNFIIINELEDLSSGLINSLNVFVKNGGSIALFPPMNANLSIYNKTLKQLQISTLSELNISKSAIDKININHPIYKYVFEGKLAKINYPQVNQYHQIITTNKSNSIALLTQENKDVFLEVFSKEKGLIYLFNSPLESTYNNFSKHALFVPTLLNMATSSVRVESIYNTISSEDYFSSSEIQNNTGIVHLKNEKIDIIPTQKTHLGKQIFFTHNQITENGIYSIEVDEKKIDAIAYNYATVESATNTLSIRELEKWKSSIGLENILIINGNTADLIATITKTQKGKEFWKIALILALLFFATEILLIKLIKS
ncbi:MAG TPA: hypothetical protein EYQ09_07435 [Flavobacteriales bacterium]|nr:hypothetical protein [Flavobacteriales bacterium]